MRVRHRIVVAIVMSVNFDGLTEVHRVAARPQLA